MLDDSPAAATSLNRRQPDCCVHKKFAAAGPGCIAPSAAVGHISL